MSFLYTIEVVEQGLTFTCKSDESILSAAERHGIAQLKVGCKGGGCGVCKVMIVEGTYELGRMSKAHCNEQQKADGLVLACRVKPTSNIRLVYPVTANHPS